MKKTKLIFLCCKTTVFEISKQSSYYKQNLTKRKKNQSDSGEKIDERL